jgi:phytoene dehydrogenase-like protein
VQRLGRNLVKATSRATPFDIIVIGGGHNGLVAAAYLQRAGLSTLVLESTAQCGGLATTTSPGPPGYFHNPHANYLMYHDLMPARADLRLRGHGLRTRWPHVQHGIAFADGRRPVVIYRSDRLEATRASVARHSAQDAETLVALLRAAGQVRSEMAQHLYRPPDLEQLNQFMRHVTAAYAGMLPSASSVWSAQALIDHTFESAEVRTLLLRIAVEWGTSVDQAGSASAFLASVLPAVGRMRLPLGGMRSLAEALASSAAAAGVTIMLRAPVVAIRTHGSRASAVQLADGAVIPARVGIVSSIGLETTLSAMLGNSSLPPKWRSDVAQFARQRATALASSMYCFRRAPDYESARWDADINRCFQVMVGLDDCEAVVRHTTEIDKGLLPEPAGAIRVNTMWDQKQAPPNRHVVGVDSFFPGLASSSAEWHDIAASYNDAFLRIWRRYALNVTADNLLDHRFVVPDSYDRKLLLRHGADQYRSPIQGLYLCGTSTFPGGGVHGACGYNAAAVILTDLR